MRCVRWVCCMTSREVQEVTPPFATPLSTCDLAVSTTRGISGSFGSVVCDAVHGTATKKSTSVAYAPMLRREADILSRMSHRLIPTLVEYADDSLVMTYCGPGCLVDWLVCPYTRSNRASCDHIALCVASALSHVHACNIAHLDVKCDNIVIDLRGEAHLVDFNLSHVHAAPRAFLAPPEEAREIHGSRGSVEYIAPEFSIGNGAPVNGFRADVWSYGVVFFTLLYCRLPWRSCGLECARFVDYVRRDEWLHPPADVLVTVNRRLANRGDVTPQHLDVLNRTLRVNPGTRDAMVEIYRSLRQEVVVGNEAQSVTDAQA